MTAHRLADLQTPALVLDRGKTEANIARMANRAMQLGVSLRPHLKTPKSISVARILLATGAQGFNVSTLREAEYFFEGGIDDLFYCVPFAPNKAARAAALVNQGCHLILMTDSLEGAQAAIEVLEAVSPRTPVPFVIELDVDGYRSGADMADCGIIAVAKALQASPATRFAGIMSYAGASYSKTPDGARDLADLHLDALARTKQTLLDAGLECSIVSIGSTPAVLNARHLNGVTEARCGIYIFQDLFQAGIGACEISDIALSVVGSVIARQPKHNRFVIDAGGLALSKDRSTADKPFDAGFGLVCDLVTGEPIDDLIVMAVSQELGLVTSKSGKPVDLDQFPVGTLIRILPNHADLMAAAYENYVVVNGDDHIETTWSRTNYWDAETSQGPPA